MIPHFSRVVAIDDVQDHLKAIAWGLSEAGFCPVPLWFDAGELDSPPKSPVPGVRVVFTDIHMVQGNMSSPKTHAATIIKCLKAVVSAGPYALIFWSMHPSEVAQMKALIEEDGPGAGLNLPIGYGSIDKQKVLVAADVVQTDGKRAFDPQALRSAILEQLKNFPTLATAASWEMRAAEASAKTTDEVFKLTNAKTPAERTAQWEGLLAYLATEAVGQAIALHDMDAALDSALLPILEDQLGFVEGPQHGTLYETHPLRSLLAAGARPDRPNTIPLGRLNASYLIDEIGAASKKGVLERGMVVRINKGFIESGELLQRFGANEADLLRREFLCIDSPTPEQIQALLPLHLLELGPECDHVQSKVSTHRYLLCVLAPAGSLEDCQRRYKKRTFAYNNDSIVDVGRIAFSAAPAQDYHLLVSTRCFTSLPPSGVLDAECRFRVRRMSLEEVMHRYTAHARRPGVMKFY